MLDFENSCCVTHQMGYCDGMKTNVTLESLKNEVVKAGFTVCSQWEDEFAIHASSSETIPGCFGHPRFEATFCKRTGWLRIGKQNPIKIA